MIRACLGFDASLQQGDLGDLFGFQQSVDRLDRLFGKFDNLVGNLGSFLSHDRRRKRSSNACQNAKLRDPQFGLLFLNFTGLNLLSNPPACWL